MQRDHYEGTEFDLTKGFAGERVFVLMLAIAKLGLPSALLRLGLVYFAGFLESSEELACLFLASVSAS
jgi:hypothetical protein